MTLLVSWEGRRLGFWGRLLQLQLHSMVPWGLQLQLQLFCDWLLVWSCEKA